MRHSMWTNLRLMGNSPVRFAVVMVMAVVLSASIIGALMKANAETRVENKPETRAENKQCFAETGRCVTGEFLTYFLQNGGVASFGYPIGSQVNVHNKVTGRTYPIQWFQYARFESHSEEPVPYKVLLGKLGEETLRGKRIDWRTLPTASGPKAGCTWFSESKHNLCDQVTGAGFKTHWRTHGLKDPRMSAYSRSLMRFGYPLTEATMEVNSEGKQVLTQWFQRARLEWHPDQPEPLKVRETLLSATLVRPSER